jgi:predicted nucleotidyltransferase
MAVAVKKKKSSFLPRKIKKLLLELKSGLTQIYGEQLKAVYLFGSFARGEGKLPDSDIDVMIVLNGEFDYWEMDKRSSELIANLSLENDVLISTKLASEAKYAESKLPLYINVRREGVSI